MYDGAPPGEEVTSVIFLGTNYVHKLEGVHTTVLVARSGVPESYYIEVNHGRNLVRYVKEF